MGCCFHHRTEVKEPLVSELEPTESKQSDYRLSEPTEQNSKWTANGYYSFRSDLEQHLAVYRVPPVVIEIISDYCHIGLDEPSNKSVFIVETVQIDDTNRLLVRYQPDLDATHYAKGQFPGRYDSIHSDVHFEPSSFGIVYFEIRLIKFFTPLLTNQPFGISVGFRNCDWAKDVVEDYVLKANGGMLGWKGQSIGLHNDDGNVFCPEFDQMSGRKTLTNNFGLNDGDVVGCGYNQMTKHVFFTKNGKLIASECVKFIDSGNGFDACVVFMCNESAIDKLKKIKKEDRECVIEFNFGSNSFAFDISRYDGEIIPKMMTFMNDIL